MRKTPKNEFSEVWCDAFGDKNEFSSWLMSEIDRAFLDARKGKRLTNDEQSFEIRLAENFELLKKRILNWTYAPGAGIAFLVNDPVLREIFAAPFVDRVVHHILYNGVAEWWNRHLIDDCYSCREGKGTLYGIQRTAAHLQSASDNYRKKVYVIKMDVSGYFMSLPQKGLYDRVLWGLKRQFENRGPKYELYAFLWKMVIFDKPVSKVEWRGRRKGWILLPWNKSLIYQAPGVGIVIGNLSSQLLSNIYLDQLDRFVKYKLGYEHYGRYVDDFYLIVGEDEIEQAKKHIQLISLKLTELGLKMHPKKTHIQDSNKGIPFLGVTIYPGRIVPGRRMIKNYQKALLEVESGKRDVDSIVSYMGILKHLNGHCTQQRIFEKAGLDFN